VGNPLLTAAGLWTRWGTSYIPLYVTVAVVTGIYAKIALHVAHTAKAAGLDEKSAANVTLRRYISALAWCVRGDCVCES
jgi:hypothetical protein